MSGDLEGCAFVGPGEWTGGSVVFSDERHDAVDEFVAGEGPVGGLGGLVSQA